MGWVPTDSQGAPYTEARSPPLKKSTTKGVAKKGVRGGEKGLGDNDRAHESTQRERGETSSEDTPNERRKKARSAAELCIGFFATGANREAKEAEHLITQGCS